MTVGARLSLLTKEMKFMRKLLFSAAMVVLAGSALAQDAMKAIIVTPDALAWKDNPALPKGAQSAILLGDPTKSGEVVVQRVRFPANYQVPPHTHPYAETVTVISGNFGFGMGEKIAHYVWTGNEQAVVQIQFVGPGGIDYINPADDPRKQ
jgi:hypothetical protein